MEKLDIIDAHDDLLGEDTFTEVHAKGLLHRAVMVMVFDSEGRLLVTQRTFNKFVYPGKLEGSATGHVKSGEVYYQAALRILRNKLHIITSPAKLKELSKFGVHDEQERMLVNLYVLKDYKNEPEIDSEEILEGNFWNLSQVFSEIEKDKSKFSPVFIHALKLFEELGENPAEFVPTS